MTRAIGETIRPFLAYFASNQKRLHSGKMLDLRTNLQASSTGWKSALLGAALLCSGAMAAYAQTQQSSPNAPVPAHTAPAAKSPSDTKGAAPASTDDNAFPEAASEAAQKKAEAAQGASNPDNAFPEAKSEAAQKHAQDGAPNGAAPFVNGEPYSSSRSRAGSLNDLLGTNESPVSDGAGHFINNTKLAKEDIRVGKFYLGQGNYAGAYMRLKEATEVGPGNVEAVYLLAEAARKSSHLDEAETNYKLYLEVEPNGRYAKDSLKALKEMAGK
jgi:tetratricopeptide (TPR) repeat protein